MLTPDMILNERYQVLRLIGQGGMGAVYEAVDQRLRARVALKQTTVSGDQLSLAFEREAQLLAGLRHPALPRVMDHFITPEGQFLIMEFIAGEDLATLIKARPGGFPPVQVLAWADQLLDALDYLHTQSPPVIHRDIKPQNLKLTPRGEIVLLDFGLAKGSIAMATQAGIQSASVFGYTPQYAPIEQVQGTGTDPRADLYSLAATLYHLLTGEPPADTLARAAAVLNGRPDPLRTVRELNPTVSATASAVLGQALALRADERFVSAAAMRRALRSDGTSGQVAHATTGPTVIVRRPPVETAIASSIDLPRPRDEVRFATESSASQIPDLPAGDAPRRAVGAREGSLTLPPTPAEFTKPARRGRPVLWLAIGLGTLLVLCLAAVPLLIFSRASNGGGNVVNVPTLDAAPASGQGEQAAPPEGDPIELDARIQGEIATPGAHDAYSFAAEPGEQIFVWTVKYEEEMAQVDLRLLDALGDEVASQCLGCSNMGVQTLDAGGTYTLVIGDDSDPATGTYELRVNRVPAAAAFAVPLDVRIAADQPGPGAGTISVPGAKQVFTFEAVAGQELFVWTNAYDAGMEQIDLRLLDALGDEVASQCLGCSNMGVQTLKAGGTYSLVIGDDSDPATGTYDVRLNAVPQTTQFNTEIPFAVGNGQPGPGAGEIVVPGAKQSFSFAVQAGQTIFVNTLRYDAGMEQIDLRLLDANGDEVVSQCLGCSIMGAQTLRAGGTYSLVVGDNTDPSTGAYELEVTLVP